MPRRLVLASASPARLQLLRGAGLHPEVMVSHVPEDGVEHLDARAAVTVLARRKAAEVAAVLAATREVRATGSESRPTAELPLVVGCDSLLEFDGETWGKPSGPLDAAHRWRRMRGGTGFLHTGHCIVDVSDAREVYAADTATVHFGRPDDREIDVYSLTAEAMEVAGPFTLEGRSSPWVESIEGNYGTITGISLVVLRELLGELGLSVIDLWSDPAGRTRPQAPA